MIIACVLKSGGDYSVAHVISLYNSIVLSGNNNFRFVCLTDFNFQIEGIETIKLKHNWKGWFSKIELFRKDIFNEPILYFDLDTVIVGKCLNLISSDGLLMIEDFFNKGKFASGIMSWNCDLSFLYEKFAENPDYWIKDYSNPPEKHGDQCFIRDFARPSFFNMQGIKSYKKHVRHHGNKIPIDANVLCFHGKPRPFEIDLDYDKFRADKKLLHG